MTINAKFYTYCQEQECSVDVDPCSDDVLAPMFVGSVHDASVMNLKTHTLRTHCIIGQKYLIAFVPVKAELYDMMEKEYNRAVNHYLADYRKPSSKYAPVFTSFEDWLSSDDVAEMGESTAIETILLADMLQNLMKEVDVRYPKYSKLLSALVTNDGEKSLDKVFMDLNISRSTGFHYLKHLRVLVEEILKTIN